MLYFILGVAVGAVIGWQVPQPKFVADLIEKAKLKIAEWRSK